jgi:hypothetical protein
LTTVSELVEQRDDEVSVAVPAAVLAHAEERHPSRRQQLLVEHARVVVADLGGTRTLVEAGVRPVLVDAVVPERPRLDAVVRRGLVEADERIRVQPVTARPVTPVDEHDLGVGRVAGTFAKPFPYRSVGPSQRGRRLRACRWGATCQIRASDSNRVLEALGGALEIQLIRCIVAARFRHIGR